MAGLSFHWEGNIPASKSHLNRLQIIQFWNPDLQIQGESHCEDVFQLKSALKSIKSGQRKIYIGDGGTSFRFLAFLLSRLEGLWEIELGDSLAKRPHDEIINILSQLGVKSSLNKNIFAIESTKWKIPDCLYVNVDKSSQFISGLCLNSWNLNQDLQMELKGNFLSYPYWNMTKQNLMDCGMQIVESDTKIVIKKSKFSTQNITAELDISSCFSLAAFAAWNGYLKVNNWSSKNFQADQEFLSILKKMGADIKETNSSLEIRSSHNWKDGGFNLKNCPDLFPVLSMLCALAAQEYNLYGSPQLKYKESNRIQKISELLDQLGVEYNAKEDGIILNNTNSINKKEFSFSSDNDHRIVFACALANFAGANIKITDKEAVNKSFPEFFEILKVAIK